MRKHGQSVTIVTQSLLFVRNTLIALPDCRQKPSSAISRIVRNGTPRLSSLKRALVLLEQVVLDGGRSNLSEIARRTDTPVATAHRQIATLVAEGYLTTSRYGRHMAGPRLRSLVALVDDRQIVTIVASPILSRLAHEARSIAQLGTLEGDMVMYRLKTGRGAGDLFTKIGRQLEAYCSGIGKILLAHLSEEDQERYLASGPFIPLTDRTITDPCALRAEFAEIRARGIAFDDGEIMTDLKCIAAPVRRPDGSVIAAISISRLESAPRGLSTTALSELLANAALNIECQAFGDVASIASPDSHGW